MSDDATILVEYATVSKASTDTGDCATYMNTQFLHLKDHVDVLLLAFAANHHRHPFPRTVIQERAFKIEGAPHRHLRHLRHHIAGLQASRRRRTSHLDPLDH